MKKSLLFLFFFIALYATAQPPDTMPPYALCDTNNDGSESFDLSSQIPAILNGLNPNTTVVTFHELLTYAQVGTGAISPDNAYISFGQNQTLYIRVHDTSAGQVYYSTINLIVNNSTNAGTDGSQTICNTSTATINLFDLIASEQQGGTWVRVSGTGGTFNATSGTYTPAAGSTTSVFSYTINANLSCPSDSSIASIIVQSCIQGPVCGDTFTDPAGATVNYASNSDYTVTICPTIPGDVVTVTFTSFNTESTWDGLYVFNGNSITSSQIASTNLAGNVPGGLAGSYWGTTIPGPFTSTDPSGCLTFRFRSDASINNPGWVANVACGAPPTCFPPTTLTVTGVTANAAVLGWSNNNATNYEVIVLPCNTTPTATATGVITSANPYTITGLNSGTCYTAFVRTICSETDVSNWSSGTSFTTIVSCPVITATTATAITSNSVTYGWTNSSNATSWEVYAVPCGSPLPTGTTAGVVTSSNPYTVTGLNPLTCYSLYVRAICSQTDVSVWSTARTITTTAAPPTCGGIFTDPAGAATNYANSTDSTVTICPTVPGYFVTVTFTAFNTEATWDGLYVFDGNSITSPQIASANPASNVPGGLAGSYWGTVIPGPFTSSDPSGCLTFRFRSDASVNNPGWVANVTCGPTPTCQKPTALNTSAITANSVTFGWTNTSSATSWEVLALPCGSPAPTATSVGVVTTSNPFVITGLNSSTCYSLYVRAICSPTDSSLWAGPMAITTLYAPPACGGAFTDPAGPTANYANSTDSTVTICSTVVGEIVTVTFTSFNTEINWDALYVFDGDSINSPQIASTNAAGNVPGGLAGGFWGTTIPGPFTSSDATGCLTFRFRSDASVNNPGWIANVTCSPPPTCPKPSALLTSGGTINSVTLGWTNNSSATSWEVLTLPCGSPAPNAATTGGIITSSNPYTITGLTDATCYDIYVRAICSDTDISLWSVKTSFTTLIIPPVCGGNYTDTGGTGNYSANADSTVTICPSTPGEVVTVTFSAFNTEANADALYVFDGDSITSPQIASSNTAANVPGGVTGGYWGTTIPGPFTSSDPSGCLTFRFRSNGTINNSGWAATVTCAPDSDKLLLVAFVDSNNNGTKEANENLYANGSFIYQQNNAGDFINAYSPTGRYALYDAVPANTYDFTYEVQPEYALYYSSGTTTFNDVSIPIGSGTQILYFPIALTQTYNDVSIVIVPISGPRPGLTYINRIIYKNLGIAAASGTLTFVKPTPVAIINISQVGTVTNATGFTYAYTSLLPNEKRYIDVTLSVPSLPTVAVNQLLTATASSTVPANDINSVNNATSNSQIILNSYDPNDKMESHGDKIPISTFSPNDYLYYTIRFQNNGNANAIDVNIQDILNVKIDEESIRMISASHNYTMTRINNTIAWEFNNIQLVPSSVSPELSKGFVYFKVKLKPGFVAGDIIPNNASIFFDANPAVVTNTFNTKFTTTLSNPIFELGDFIMYPNPADSNVHISLKNAAENIESLTITDILGKTIKNIKNITTNEINVDVSNLTSGVYFVEITSESNLKLVKKIVVQ